MISPRHRYALLLTVVVVGGVLRFGAAGYGLPRHDLGQDEMITATRVRDSVLVGHKGWPRFHWPNLNVHMSRGVVEAVRWVESRAGLGALDDVLIGRVYTAVLGTLTLVALYLAAARLFDPLIGVAAAGFLAVIPLHAFRSRLWVPDVPMTFFYTLALLAAAWILARPTYTRFVLGAVAVGLATATKYNGVGACLPVAVAAVLALPVIQDRWRLAAILSRLVLGAAISVAVFFAADPFALARFDEMLNGMAFISGSYIDAPASGFLGWHIWVYIARSFYAGGYEGVGPLISILALSGWALLLVRRSRAGLLAWLPGLLSLLAFSSILHDPFERMFLPLTPHITMLAAAAPVTRHMVAARHDETRVKAAQWLDANVPAGAFIKREWDMVWPGSRRFDFNRQVHDLWEGRWTPQLVSQHVDFVVTTSTNFERVRRQRRRPIYARQASYYDEMFAGPLFELAARFEPDLYTFGPEVRIYRTLRPRGGVLGPAKTDLDLLRQVPWVSTIRLRQEQRQEGGFRFRAAHELIAGKASVRPGGWYTLEVSAMTSTVAPLEIGLGDRLKTFHIEGEQTVAVRAFLRQGKIWWRVGAGPDLAETDELLVHGARLVRVPSEGGDVGSRVAGQVVAGTVAAEE